IKKLRKIPDFFKNKKIVYIFLFAILVIIMLTYKMLNKKINRIENNLPFVTVEKAELGSVIRYIDAIGTLRPHNSVIIKSEASSTISKIHFTEGTTVKKGDLLIELDDAAARAALMEAEAYYRKAKSEFEPVEKLADRGVMARVGRDKLKAEVDVCAAKVESCKNTLSKHKIFAPFNGIIGLKEISEGQFVSPGNELVKLVDANPLKVDFKVIEADINHVYVGQEVKVLVGGDKTQEVSAKIIAIDPESDKISHSFNVRAELGILDEVAESIPTLKPGRFVSIKVIPDESQQGILVPESAIEKNGDEEFLYRIIEGIAVRTLVTTGVRKNGMIEIITGVNEGETVVTAGQQGVLDGRGVSIQTREYLEQLMNRMRSQVAKKNNQKKAKR
ncbi:MAG: efflux RND transporter periplasmic adaptor subunit, partial [Alphaproteobacteria bacterium]|nr:efflux RND transporter periplasmic adaptor subunit [Alphaproteobacteria bacterium]